MNKPFNSLTDMMTSREFLTQYHLSASTDCSRTPQNRDFHRRRAAELAGLKYVWEWTIVVARARQVAKRGTQDAV